MAEAESIPMNSNKCSNHYHLASYRELELKMVTDAATRPSSRWSLCSSAWWLQKQTRTEEAGGPVVHHLFISQARLQNGKINNNVMIHEMERSFVGCLCAGQASKRVCIWIDIMLLLLWGCGGKGGLLCAILCGQKRGKLIAEATQTRWMWLVEWHKKKVYDNDNKQTNCLLGVRVRALDEKKKF